MSLKLQRQVPGRAHGELVSAPYVLNTITVADAKTPATPTLYTVPAGTTIVVTEVLIRCTAASGITAVATAGIGIASGEDDIFASQPLYGLDAAGKEFSFPVGGASVTAQASDVIKLGIDVGATGTSQAWEVDIMGYEV